VQSKKNLLLRNWVSICTIW